MQWFLLLALLSVFAALATAVYFLLGKPTSAPDQDTNDEAAAPDRTRKMARALAWRVGLSIALVMFLLMAYALGWVEPHAAPIGR